MRGFLPRMANSFICPRKEWAVIQAEQTTYRKVLSGYVAMIAAVPPLAALAEKLLFSRGIAGNAPLGQAVALNAAWYFMIIVNMIITSAVITAFVFNNEPSWFSLRGLQLASFSFTPLFLAALPAMIPSLNRVLYPAILYSIFLLYHGIRTMTGIAPGRAAACAAVSFSAAALIVGVLNGMEYMLESFILSKVIPAG